MSRLANVASVLAPFAEKNGDDSGNRKCKWYDRQCMHDADDHAIVATTLAAYVDPHVNDNTMLMLTQLDTKCNWNAMGRTAMQ